MTVTILSLVSRAHAGDLANALIGVSGVDEIRVDVEQQTVVVTYDPGLLDPTYLWRVIAWVGYPVDAERSPSPNT
jgi:copper chaperone CopZ